MYIMSAHNSYSICFIILVVLACRTSGQLDTTSSPAVSNNRTNECPPQISGDDIKRAKPFHPQLRVPRDEFNSTESIRFNIVENESSSSPSRQQLSSLKNLLLRSPLHGCCPKWNNLTINPDILDELRRKFGKQKSPPILRGSDLLGELSITFANITYLSIDGQPGENECDKYYSFYDNVHYFLRLLKVAHEFLIEREQRQLINDHAANLQEIDFTKKFQRQLKSLEFKTDQDPIMSSFIQELTSGSNSSHNHHFDYYEDFLGETKFGQYYARNISKIRESVMAFDEICSHLVHVDLLGNLTRPSKQYDLVRRMSYELYSIRKELVEQVSIRVLSNRPDIQRIFAKLHDFTETRPYIRMLGDEFSSNPPNFKDHVRRLTQLLDRYLRNNMTQALFYNSLAELPEDFILLGSSIAHYYEIKELPYFSKFDAQYFGQNISSQQNITESGNQTTLPNRKPIDARRSNLSLLTRLFE